MVKFKNVARKYRKLWAFLCLCIGDAYAESSLDCPNASLFSQRLLSDICWSCLFPLNIGGINLSSLDLPQGASRKSLCLCDDPLGLPKPGIVTGMWQPVHLIELVRKPGCSPVLGGMTLPLGSKLSQGSHGEGNFDIGDLAFFHYHYYSFPIMAMLDMFISPQCARDSYLDFDLMFASELDPTWLNDELAFFAHPESILFANPQAVTACVSDAISSSSGKPIDTLFWCAGSFGHLYPLSGHTLAMGSFAQKTSHLATRSLAISHRRGFAKKTMGDKALCGPVTELMLPKSQYKMSMFFPLPESTSSHQIGESTINWGEWRSIPGAGEDAVYLLWCWQDCCNTGGGF
ncbi:TraU family protein [Thorsellia kenyensis]|uniref:TraU family protein n=1 Tax=Thorsellia kenyensis TaxID=1549888 RepID=A0ABV6CEA2_9GAMM